MTERWICTGKTTHRRKPEPQPREPIFSIAHALHGPDRNRRKAARKIVRLMGGQA